jgi:hypothetical protein
MARAAIEHRHGSQIAQQNPGPFPDTPQGAKKRHDVVKKEQVGNLPVFHAGRNLR